MAARGLFINSTEQGFRVRGVANNFFPDNATLAYPANSVILITDDSDMATFRSASNYDVLFSALIKDIDINGERVTKDNIIGKFNEAANKPMSNPDSFTSVEYDGKNDLIFYNDKGEEVAKVDVTPFIKDGMIEDVEISDGNLVIHFNTDSEIKDIYIPLTEIFDPNQYYTKTEIDAKEGVITQALNAKANASEVYSKTESDAKYATQVVVNEEIAARIEAIRDVNTALEGKADKTDTYTKTQVDTAISTAIGQIDLSDYQTKEDADVKEEVVSTALNELEENKQDKLTAGANITIENNVISSTVPDTSEFVTKEEYNPKEVAIAQALTQLNENKADKSEIPVVPDMSNYYTKTETDNTFVSQAEFDVKEEVISTALNTLNTSKQDVLTAGANITIQNNVISATGGGGGTQVQADWNETVTTDPAYIQNKPTIPSNTSDLTNDSNFVEGGGDIVSIVKISQSDYDALVSPKPYTLYIITSNV